MGFRRSAAGLPSAEGGSSFRRCDGEWKFSYCGTICRYERQGRVFAVATARINERVRSARAFG
ncbi:MAG: hypothetical protein RR540_02500, partial [Oscillospiraceae bacterium]